MFRVTLVVGQAQQGKTTLALKLVEREASRVLILDPANSKPFHSVATTWRTWTELKTFLVSNEAKGKWIGKLSSMDFEDYASALAHARHYRHVTILVDEGMMFAQDAEASEWLIKAARTNAHYGGGIGVPLVITAQRPLDLPRDVRSQVDRWYSFRQEEPGDLQYLSERCKPEFAVQVAGLAPHQWLEFPPPTKAVAGVEQNDGHAWQGVSVGHGGGTGNAGRAPDVPEAQPDPSPSRGAEVTAPGT